MLYQTITSIFFELLTKLCFITTKFITADITIRITRCTYTPEVFIIESKVFLKMGCRYFKACSNICKFFKMIIYQPKHYLIKNRHSYPMMFFPILLNSNFNHLRKSNLNEKKNHVLYDQKILIFRISSNQHLRRRNCFSTFRIHSPFNKQFVHNQLQVKQISILLGSLLKYVRVQLIYFADLCAHIKLQCL